MSKEFLTERLKQRFSGQINVTREDLYDFYRVYEPDLKEATFGWRIYALKEKNLLRQVRRGVYIFSSKPHYHPVLDPKLKDLGSAIIKQFPVAKYCLWRTKWLNDWTLHQPGRFLILAEVEAQATESVFYFLKHNNYKNVFVNPDETLLERYAYEQKESIIVKKLVSKAPLNKEQRIIIPSLEKILVDLFVDRKLFAPFQGKELVNIYNSAHKEYALNITRLLAYARRRTKDKEVLDFIKKNTKLRELIKE